MFKNEIMPLLKMGIVTVRFLKLDETERIMNCTLDPLRIPTESKEEPGYKRKNPENLISAWDIDAKGWRSFYSDRVISASLMQ